MLWPTQTSSAHGVAVVGFWLYTVLWKQTLSLDQCCGNYSLQIINYYCHYLRTYYHYHYFNDLFPLQLLEGHYNYDYNCTNWEFIFKKYITYPPSIFHQSRINTVCASVQVSVWLHLLFSSTSTILFLATPPPPSPLLSLVCEFVCFPY